MTRADRTLIDVNAREASTHGPSHSRIRRRRVALALSRQGRRRGCEENRRGHCGDRRQAFRLERARLGGRAKEALDDLAAKPDSEDNQADLRKQLAKALEADPALAGELRAMLPADAAGSDSMSQTVSGAGAKAAQVKGSGNTTSIS